MVAQRFLLCALVAIGGAFARSTHISLENPEDDFIFYEGSLEPQHGDFSRAPIIGILTTPWNGTEYDKQSGFLDHYVRWLEQGGAKIVPIKYNLPHDQLDHLFESINGLFYTGGGLSLRPTTPYYDSAYYLYKKAIEANRRGDFFPIWGTCMGFQLMSIMTSDDYDVLSHNAYKTEGVSLPLEFDPLALAQSRMFRHFPKPLIRMLATRPLTSNLHHDGVTPEDWYSRPALADFYRVISMNHDPYTGKPFVSTIEGKHFPFYGVQWHPERPQFDWKEGEGINRGAATVRAMFAFSEFFVNEARKNKHRFANKSEEDRLFIFNFQPVKQGNTSLLYLFDD